MYRLCINHLLRTIKSEIIFSNKKYELLESICRNAKDYRMAFYYKTRLDIIY